MNKFVISFLSMAVTAAAVFGWSKDGENPWRRIDDSLVTPHRTFARPAAGRKNTVMIMASGLGQRELVEFKQRFDYNYVLLPIRSMKFFSPFDPNHKDAASGSLYAASMTREEYAEELNSILHKDLPQCDGIVLGKLPYSAVPKDVRNKILQHVQQGAVFFLIADRTKPQDVPGMKFTAAEIDFPTAAIPILKGVRIEAAAYGKGKIVIIRYPGFQGKQSVHNLVESLTPFESDDPLYYDYCLAFLGKVFWHFMQPERHFITSFDSSGKIVLKNPPAGSRIHYEIMDRFGEKLLQQECPARTINALPLPALPGSARMLDMKLLDKDGAVLDFQCTSLQPATAPKIVIFLPKDGYLPDEPITGNISTAIPGLSAEITLTDDFGRLIHRETLKSLPEKYSFDFRIPYFMSNTAVLKARLLMKDTLIDEDRALIYFNNTGDISDFSFGMWSYAVSRSRVVSLWLKEMSRHGVDTVMDAAVMFSPRRQCFQAPRKLKQAGMKYAIYISRLTGHHYLQQTGKCPYNLWEKYQKEGKFYGRDGNPIQKPDQVMIQAEGAKNIGVLFYNMGDENASSNQKYENCFCKECQRRFRSYLKKQYKSLAALNREYGTNYHDFGEIIALPFEKAVEKDLCPMWQDFRLFMEEQFIDWHRFEKAKIRSVDSAARCGIEGMAYPANSFTGFNLYKMLPHFEFCAPYFDSRDIHAVNQYLCRQNSLKSAWFGTYEGEMTDQFVQQPPWRYLFNGLGGAFYWYSGDPKTSGAFSTSCISGPDLRMLSQFTKAADEINRIKNSGVGRLLMNSRQHQDGILVHYSNYSLHSSTISPDKTSWFIAHREIGTLLESLGLGYSFITPPELEKGVPAGTRILILPYSQAMTELESQQIRSFVKNGGMVIADYNPGTMTEHGRFLDQSRLANVFGEFRKLNIHSFGKGTAVYLDDYLSGVDARIQKNEASGIQNGMLRIFKEAGVSPFASVKDGMNKIQPASIFEYDGARYICLLAQRSKQGEKRTSIAGAEAGASALTTVGGSFRRTITLPQAMHVYDILNRNKYLGKISSFTTELTPAVGRIFACTPVQPETPLIRIWRKSVVRGRSVDIIPKKISNVAILSITDPNGSLIFARRVTAKEKVRFVPALNAPAGIYRITIKDVVCGRSSSTDIKVK